MPNVALVEPHVRQCLKALTSHTFTDIEAAVRAARDRMHIDYMVQIAGVKDTAQSYAHTAADLDIELRSRRFGEHAGDSVQVWLPEER
jgi:hypothetical protein